VLRRWTCWRSSRAGQKAFWLNVYNALIVHGFTPTRPPLAPAAPRLLLLHPVHRRHHASAEFSLGPDQEHGVLKGNHPGAGAGVAGAAPLRPQGTQGATTACPPWTPVSTFALNCGARSCPPIRLYSEESASSRSSTLLLRPFCRRRCGFSKGGRGDN